MRLVRELLWLWCWLCVWVFVGEIVLSLLSVRSPLNLSHMLFGTTVGYLVARW